MKCEKTATLIENANQKINNIAENYLAPLLLLGLRLFIAQIFFKSGLIKISNLETTTLLFEYEYAIPYLNPSFAAYSATFFELICPILLILGLASRIATLPLIVMTLVIQFIVYAGSENAAQYFTYHLNWFLALAAIFCFGAGPISLDKFIKPIINKFCPQK